MSGIDSALATADKVLIDLAIVAKLVGFIYPPAAIVAMGLGGAAQAVEAAEKLRAYIEAHRTGTATPAQAAEALAAIKAFAQVQEEMFAAQSVG